MSYPPPPPPPGPSSPSPVPAYSAVRTPVVPAAVRVAVWSFWAAALWAVGSAVAFAWWVHASLKDLDKAVSAGTAVADLGLEGRAADVARRVLAAASDDRWRAIVLAVGIAFVVVALLASVVYVVLARSLRRGSSAARGIATALAVVSLLWLVLGPQAWFWVLLNVVGVVAAWRPESSAYLSAARAARIDRRFRA